MLSPIAWLANKLYAIEEKSKEVANAYRMDLVYCLAQRCKLKSATITLPENQSVHRDVGTRMQSCIKACQNCFTVNTAITVKLLKSKVTLNICETLKMTQRDTGNIKSKVNENCCCETCHI